MIPSSHAAAFALEAVRDEIETISEFFDSREAGRWALIPICEVEIRPYRIILSLESFKNPFVFRLVDIRREIPAPFDMSRYHHLSKHPLHTDHVSHT